MKQSSEQAAPRADVNRQARRRQHALLYAGVALVAALALLISLARGRDATPERQLPRLAAPGADVDAGTLWRESAEQDIRQLTEGERLLRESMDSMEARLADMADSIDSLRAATEENAFEYELLQLAPQPDVLSQPAQLLAEQSDPFVDALPPDPPAPPRGISLLKIDAAATVTGTLAASPSPVEPPPVQRSEDYIPGGSFMRAVILGGIDAPTGNIARDNPHPVLLRVADHARLPSLARKDLRECLVLAAGYGDIASERALLRTERMSCQRPDRSFFDAPIRGFVVGEDGRAGLRGRLVTKQGQVLQQALFAGIGAGFGDVFQKRYADQISARNLGQAQAGSSAESNTIGDYATASIATGASTALGRLADYYLRMADRIHPIIEVGAGRTVDIVLQEGVDLNARHAER